MNDITQFKPAPKRVLIEVLPTTNQTKSGFILPDSAVQKSTVGTIVAKGDNCWENSDFNPQPSDSILYALNAGTPIEYEGKQYLLIRDADVHAQLAS
jgi:chaperonin GroES